MALIGSKSDFKPQKVDYVRCCGECRKRIKPGEEALVSMRYGKVQKVVCSEKCRQDFDWAFWEERANMRAAGLLEDGKEVL